MIESTPAKAAADKARAAYRQTAEEFEEFAKNGQMPEAVRVFAEKNIAQTREFYERSKDAFDKILESWEKTFDAATIPAALRADHTLKAGVWARICVLSGRLRFRMQQPPRDEELSPERGGVIPPEAPHSVEPIGEVAFYVEFHRRAKPRGDPEPG